MLYKIVPEKIAAGHFINQLLHLDHLTSALVETKVVAGLQVDGRGAVRVLL